MSPEWQPGGELFNFSSGSVWMDQSFSSEGWEFCPCVEAIRWYNLVKRLFVVRHLQQWYNVCGQALQLYRSEIRDSVSRVLWPGKGK